jgi:hypothetical protein
MCRRTSGGKGWPTPASRWRISSGRRAATFACAFLGLLGLWSLVDGDDPVPNILMLVGGVAALATFAVRSWLLLGAAVVLCLAGLVWILA